MYNGLGEQECVLNYNTSSVLLTANYFARFREEFKINVMGLLAKFLVQSNVGEPSREICPEIAFGRSCECLRQRADPTGKSFLGVTNM